MTLAYPSVADCLERVGIVHETLQGSKFLVEQEDDTALRVSDPWGNHFRLVHCEPTARDPSGQQPGDGESMGLSLQDLTIYTPVNSNMAGCKR